MVFSYDIETLWNKIDKKSEMSLEWVVLEIPGGMQQNYKGLDSARHIGSINFNSFTKLMHEDDHKLSRRHSGLYFCQSCKWLNYFLNFIF